MPFDPWKQKLAPLNPKPENRKFPEQLNETGEEALKDGYSVLDRANPASPYNRARRGLSAPVYDHPNVGWDE
jgi:hypothetical protein